MLTARTNTTAAEFIAQLRTYVIAMGLGPHVVDCVDNLVGADGIEDEHEKAVAEAEERGRESMKNEILAAADRYVYEAELAIGMPAADMLIKEIEKVKI